MQWWTEYLLSAPPSLLQEPEHLKEGFAKGQPFLLLSSTCKKRVSRGLGGNTGVYMIKLGNLEGFSLGHVQPGRWRKCTRNPVIRDASANFWRQKQSPECGELAIHYDLRSSKLVPSRVLIQWLRHCPQTFHRWKEGRGGNSTQSSVFSVSGSLPFKKYPSTCHSFIKHLLSTLSV